MLIIDTPKSCEKCKLTYFNDWNEVSCSLTGECIDNYKNKKSPWCPLSLLPERINLRQYVDNCAADMNSVMAYAYAQGRNDCLDEILEEE